MTDFLGRLAAREVGAAPVLTPRMPSRFETARDVQSPPEDLETQIETVRTVAASPVATTDSAGRIAEPRRPEASATAPARVPATPAPATMERNRAPAPREAGMPVLALSARVVTVEGARPVPGAAPAPGPPRIEGPLRDPVQPVRVRVVPEPAPSRPGMQEPERPSTSRVLVRHERAPMMPAIAPGLAAAPRQTPTAAEPETVVQVHIGRIEVRAPAAAASAPRSPAAPRPMSLSEYLKSRGARGAS